MQDKCFAATVGLHCTASHYSSRTVYTSIQYYNFKSKILLIAICSFFVNKLIRHTIVKIEFPDSINASQLKHRQNTVNWKLDVKIRDFPDKAPRRWSAPLHTVHFQYQVTLHVAFFIDIIQSTERCCFILHVLLHIFKVNYLLMQSVQALLKYFSGPLHGIFSISLSFMLRTLHLCSQKRGMTSWISDEGRSTGRYLRQQAFQAHVALLLSSLFAYVYYLETEFHPKDKRALASS